MASHPCMGETLGGEMHRGLPDRRVSVYIGDIEEMVDLGLLAVRYYGEHQLNFDVSTLGFQVRGRTIDFRHEFAPLGEREVWYRWAFDEGKALDIYTNTDFPAYFTTRDKAFYAAIHIAESIAQLMARECSLDASEADDVKQLILRKASAVKDQWIDEDESANGSDGVEAGAADE